MIGRDVGNWSQPFLEAVLAYLRPPPPPSQQQRGQEPAPEPTSFRSMLNAAIAVEAEPEDEWLRFQFDGTFIEAVRFTLRQGYWRFALRTIDITTPSTAAPATGYAYCYDQPPDWLRTNSLFISVPGTGLEHPLDIKEHDRAWSTNATDFVVRYVSSIAGLDPLVWPQPFLEAVLAYLKPAPAEQGQRGPEPPVSPFERTLAAAMAVLCEPEDPWLRHQLSGTFLEALRFTLKQGYWRFALRTVEITTPDTTAIPAVGYTTTYAFPGDWIRTHGLFVSVPGTGLEHPFDIREHDRHWSTDERSFAARYVSAHFGLDPLLWPQPFLEAVLAYLMPTQAAQGRQGQAEPSGFQVALATALAGFSEPEDPWFRHQVDGSFIEATRYVLKQGAWRFALKTTELANPDATPAFGYAYGYHQPGDWLRTHSLFVAIAGTGLAHPLDIKEHDRQWSTDATGFAARYVSAQLGLDPLKWPQPFLAAVMAYLAPTPAPASAEQGARPEVSPFIGILGNALGGFAEPDDPWLRHQLDGSFVEGLRYLLKQGAWRFALRTVAQADLTTAPPAVGYSTAWGKPSDWLRTHSLFLPISGTGLEHPFDVREQSAVVDRLPDFAARMSRRSLASIRRSGRSRFSRHCSPTSRRTARCRARRPSRGLAVPRHLAQALASFAEPEDPWLSSARRLVHRSRALRPAPGLLDFAPAPKEFTAPPITQLPETTPQIGYPGHLQPVDSCAATATLSRLGDGRSTRSTSAKTSTTSARPHLISRYGMSRGTAASTHITGRSPSSMSY